MRALPLANISLSPLPIEEVLLSSQMPARFPTAGLIDKFDECRGVRLLTRSAANAQSAVMLLSCGASSLPDHGFV